MVQVSTVVRQPLNLFASSRLTQRLWYIRGLFVGPMCVFYKNPQSKDPLELLAHSPHDLKAQQHNQSLLRRSCLTSPHFMEGCENYKEPLSIHLFSITTNSALTVAEADSDNSPCQWEESGITEGSPHRLRKNMQTQQREARVGVEPGDCLAVGLQR